MAESRGRDSGGLPRTILGAGKPRASYDGLGIILGPLINAARENAGLPGGAIPKTRPPAPTGTQFAALSKSVDDLRSSQASANAVLPGTGDLTINSKKRKLSGPSASIGVRDFGVGLNTGL